MPDRGAWVTWYEACESNLQIAMPEPPKGLIARREHQLVSRAAARTYDELIADPSPRQRLTAASVTLVALSVVVLAGVLLLGTATLWPALAGSGCWRWPSVLLGALLFWLLVPRPTRLRDDLLDR